MFFDNGKYLAFVEQARRYGITVPIIPGIKPLSRLRQLASLPKTFNIGLPQELVSEAFLCKKEEEIKQLGINWAVGQCRELKERGVPSFHFYSTGSTDIIREIVKQIY